MVWRPDFTHSVDHAIVKDKVSVCLKNPADDWCSSLIKNRQNRERIPKVSDNTI